ncbi:ELAV-like protein 1-B [Ruditapes philippinarum]|uniref:ELAV-like protein 1-B n=1 Tax=Ruditapes philippinarum TaxID=129788 RepID=UPI00295B372B|nr:ELAV-like protein 1-B [Ruditapes philippinarum]
MAAGGLHFGNPMVKQNTLIINNLPDYMGDDELESMFKTYGTVKTASVRRDPKTNKSLAFGFVEYSKRDEGKKAIENVDGLQLGKKKLRVAFSEPIDEAIKHATKVTVKKLPAKFSEEDFKGMFAKFGKIVKVRLLVDSVTGKSRRLGFLFYENWADAQKAVNEMNGFKPEQSKDPLKVNFDQESVKPKTWPQWQKASDQQQVGYQHRAPHALTGSRPHSQQGPSKSIPSVITQGPNPSCVFLYNIGEYISEQEIYNMFAQFGGLKKIDIVRDMNTQLCKGYAFLNFDTYQAAENAIFTMDGMFYRGRQLQVRFKYN